MTPAKPPRLELQFASEAIMRPPCQAQSDIRHRLRRLSCCFQIAATAPASSASGSIASCRAQSASASRRSRTTTAIAARPLARDLIIVPSRLRAGHATPYGPELQCNQQRFQWPAADQCASAMVAGTQIMAMHPNRRVQRELQDQRRAEHDEPEPHDDEHRRAVSGVDEFVGKAAVFARLLANRD